ncbi:hypothetical protein CYMTET_40089 [Cymbomonas tetramitiformis]|uniref:Uncharacterized protein n=1 Tax=Cymbomonas tetramitiformis TaxID=36881 RepID=A0AAE0C9T9_9CHLO|nr:hypothetical protein CYMTET_40089 [Cymbomonas tetramitiformis]
MDENHYAELERYLRHRQKHGATNIHYSCFAHCAARLVDRLEYHPVTIVSVDHDPVAKLRFQVFFNSNKDKHNTAYCDTAAVVLDSTTKTTCSSANATPTTGHPISRTPFTWTRLTTSNPQPRSTLVPTSTSIGTRHSLTRCTESQHLDELIL